MASVRDTIGQLRKLWTDLSTGKKISFILIFTVMVAGFVILVMWAGRPDYKMLQSGLSPEDANAVVTHLEDQRIPYRLTEGGSAVSVSSSQFYEAKMSLASAGLPTGGSVGFELFDGKSLGQTDAQMKINRLRVLQGELQRTINQLEPVESSRVHLALPEESLFIEDRQEAKASVIIGLKGNKRLTNENIEGIIYLVSSSIEGLDPQNVTIVDTKGKVLSKAQNDQMGESDLEDRARKMERELEQKIVSLLASSVGVEKVQARVSVQLDREHVQQVKQEYDPDSLVMRSEQKITSTNKSNESQTGAAPGALTNLPEGSPTMSSGNFAEGVKDQSTKNYEISSTTSTITIPSGTLRKLSVAVMIDGTYQESGEGDEKKTEYTPRTEEQMATYTAIVKNAVGFNEKRGDQIEVANVQFITEDHALEEPTRRLDLIIKIINYVLAALGVLLFLLFVLRPLIRWLTSEPALEAQLGLPADMLAGAPTVAELEAKLARRELPDMTEKEAEAKAKVDELSEKMTKLKESKEDLLNTAARDRDAVTLMVRRWLKEGVKETAEI